MSGYKELYKYCQSLEPKISRKLITQKALEITGEKVVSIKTGMDLEDGRGMFYSATNTSERIVQQLGCNVIVVARGQKYCWDRFVYTKELMHLFDSEDQLANTPEKFDSILSSFQISPGGNPVAASEHIAFWKALGCLCPEKYRSEFKEAISATKTDYYSIALKLKIPEQYVPYLFVENYEELMDFISN